MSICTILCVHYIYHWNVNIFITRDNVLRQVTEIIHYRIDNVANSHQILSRLTK